MTETFKDKITIRAAMGTTVVGILQHPVEIAKDWRVYLKSDNPAEEKRRDTVRQELLEKSASFDTEDKAFSDEYSKMGCEVDVTVGDINLFPRI